MIDYNATRYRLSTPFVIRWPCRDLARNMKRGLIVGNQEKAERSRGRLAPPRAAAAMVRPASPPATVAAARGRAGRSVPGLAVGDHAAADRGEDGRAVFRKIRGALAQRRCARRRLARRRVADVGGARLLLAGAQFARLRGRG